MSARPLNFTIRFRPCLRIATQFISGTSFYLLIWRNLKRWWIYLLSGVFAGTFPGFFYLVVAPLTDAVMAVIIAMLIVGTVWGALVGLVVYVVVGRPVAAGP